MRAQRLCSLFLALAPVLGWAAPTAILVDTSRSIPPAQFEAVKSQIGTLLPDLAAKGPVALYAFNDGPVRLSDFTGDETALRSAVQQLSQGGRFTLLYDCLFAAEKDLAAKGEPGLILLFTDGRDENSAVTLEDFASRASTAHVTVVSAGVGAADEKTLRRLAVLTGGRYAGPMGAAGAGDLAQALRETLASLPLPSPPPPKAQAEPPAPAPAPSSPQPSGLRRFWLLIVLMTVFGLALLAAIGAGVVLLLRRTKAPEDRSCEQCGRPLNVWEGECPACLAKSLALPKGHESTESALAEPPLPELDPVLLQKTALSDLVEHTLVLDQVPVLVLQRPGGPPRMFQLPPEGAVSVGRDKLNTLSVADQTLSAQHFRIIPKEGKFYLVDLKSTNGTSLDGRRVSLVELKPGSVIRAGQCEFVFRIEQKKLN